MSFFPSSKSTEVIMTFESDFEFVFKLADLPDSDCNDIVRSSLKGTIRFGETGQVTSRASGTILLKTRLLVSDFMKKLGQTYEKFSSDLKNLVRGFKKRSDDSKKERYVYHHSNKNRTHHCGRRFSWQGHLYRFWEVLLAEVGEEAKVGPQCFLFIYKIIVPCINIWDDHFLYIGLLSSRFES